MVRSYLSAFWVAFTLDPDTGFNKVVGYQQHLRPRRKHCTGPIHARWLVGFPNIIFKTTNGDFSPV